MNPIRVINTNFEIVTEIDRYTSAIVTRSWHGIGELELTINKYSPGASLLQRGVLLLVGAKMNKAYIIRHREIELTEDGKESENWKIKALSLKSILGQRLTLPPSNTSYDNKQGPAETVMKHYITNNVINPDDANRIIPLISIAPDQGRGSNVSWRSRYKNLAEELADISFSSGAGWNSKLDITNHKFEFDIQEGRDLTASQNALPPVIFSPQFDSLRSLNYSESELNYRNVAYVAGQGEGTDRRVIELGDSTGMERYELFADARNVDEETDADPPQPRPEQDIIDDLTAQGHKELDKMTQERYLEGQVLTKSPFIYEKDYDLGDIVTVQNKDWGVTMDVRITEIKEIYEEEGFNIEATFGNDRPTLIDKIKQQFSQISPEVRK